MERLKINVEKRSEVGKQAAKRLRDAGRIPAVIYGKEINTSVAVPAEAFKVLKNAHFSESTVIDLNFDEKEKKDSIPVLIKDIQTHPLTDQVIHLDLLKVSLKEKIRVHIPIVFKGQAQGKEEGAVLEQILHEIEVESLPLNIPEKFEVDISGIEIGHSLHVKDLQALGDIEVITEPEATIATLLVKKEEEPEEEELEEEVSAEPEVIKEKKEEGQPESEPGQDSPKQKPETESKS